MKTNGISDLTRKDRQRLESTLGEQPCPFTGKEMISREYFGIYYEPDCLVVYCCKLIREEAELSELAESISVPCSMNFAESICRLYEQGMQHQKEQ